MPFRDSKPSFLFGFGVDDFSGEARGGAVTTDEFQDAQGGGQVVDFRLSRVETLEDLQQSIGLSVDASASFGVFGGSEKFSFVENSHFHRFSVFLSVHVVVTNPFRFLVNEQLRPVGRDLLANGNVTRFREEFGDFYVKGIQTGGEFLSLLEVKTSSEADQEKVINQLDAGGGLGGIGVDVKTEFVRSVSSLKADHSIDIKSFQVGGSDTTQPTEVQAVIDKASTFAESVKLSSKDFRVFLQTYTALDLPPGPNLIDLQNEKLVLTHLSRIRNDLFNKLNEIDFMIDNPGQFETPSGDLNIVRKQTAEALNLLKDRASACANKPVTECKIPEELIQPDFGILPKRIGETGGGPLVPSLVGQPLLDAESQVRIRGLQFSVIDLGGGGDFVTGQDPAADSIVPPNSKIFIFIGGPKKGPGSSR